MTEDEPANFNLSKLSFDELVDFLFARPVMKDFDERYTAFYHGYGSFVPVPPERFLVNVTAIFTRLQEIQRRFTREQHAQGIAELFAPMGFSTQEYFFIATVPLKARTECVQSLYHIYAEALQVWTDEPSPGIFYMLWDNINSHAAYTINRTPGAVDTEILDAIFQTLSRILELPDIGTQGCALHGLGHLRHSGVRSLVQSYIDSHRSDLSPDELAWIEQCRDGTVM